MDPAWIGVISVLGGTILGGAIGLLTNLQANKASSERELRNLKATLREKQIVRITGLYADAISVLTSEGAIFLEKGKVAASNIMARLRLEGSQAVFAEFIETINSKEAMNSKTISVKKMADEMAQHISELKRELPFEE